MTTHEVRKRTSKKHANFESNTLLAYTLRREPIQVSPKRSDPSQVQLSSSSNETVLHSLTLKNGSVHGSEKDSLQGDNVQDDSIQDSEIVVYKMTVCKIQKWQFAR